jgi:LysR family transcriptional regulator, transcriptional activator of nhaA
MTQLNFKHLRYFWTVARTGSMARAAQQLNLAPQSISGQLAEFEAVLGTKLFQRSGRSVELTEAGKRILTHADDIFSAGDELLASLRDASRVSTPEFRIGIADSVGKSVAYKLIEPVLTLRDPIRLICREGRLNTLLADLALHKLDLIIADRAVPSKLSVRAYSHVLGESGTAFFATRSLARTLKGGFPKSLEGAPMLLPGDDVALRQRINQWLEQHRLHPRVVGEFDDSALMKEFGQAGAGVFTAPAAISALICARYSVVELGRVDTLLAQIYAITSERRLKHPASVAIGKVAKDKVFASV